MPSCGSCSREVSSEAKFCPACGTATKVGRVSIRSELYARRLSEGRAAWVLALVFGGGLMAVFLPSLLFPESLEYTWSDITVQFAADLMVFGLALALLAPAKRVQVWGVLPRSPTSWLHAVVVGLVGFVVAVAYAYGLNYLLGGVEELSLAELGVPFIVSVVLLAPIAEELLMRGAAYQAAQEFGGPGTVIVMTAIMFAILHGLNGSFVLEFPHRFIGGLALGWLRWRHDSLTLCIFAHFVWNSCAVASSS